jgi:hypothetical protein
LTSSTSPARCASPRGFGGAGQGVAVATGVGVDPPEGVPPPHAAAVSSPATASVSVIRFGIT